MKTRSFAVDLLLLASILLSTSCAAPTPVASPTPPATQTLSPTATQTTVPTETSTPTETPIANEFIKLNIISSVEFEDPQGLINTSIKIDESMRMRPPGMSVDEIVINENFPRNQESAMAQFSQHLIYKAVVKTNPESANLTFDQFVDRWRKYKSGDIEAKKHIEFKVFDDASQKEISITPNNLEFVFGNASKLEGLHKFMTKYDHGFRIEYHPNDNTLSIIIADSLLPGDVDSYINFAGAMAKSANLIIKYKGDDLANFNYTNIDEKLRGFITIGNRVIFQVKRNGMPASDKEAELNP